MIALALVGLGDHMLFRLYPFLLKLPIRIVAVCDINRDKIERFRNINEGCRYYTDYLKMIADERIDALVCAVNAEVHYAVARACMRKGISPFVEKTPCKSYTQAEILLTMQKETNQFTMVGFNRRYTTAYMMAKEIINRDEFGKPLMYMAKYNSSAYTTDKYFVFNHMIHHLDLARYLIGEIKEIRSDEIKLSEQKVGYHISLVAENGAIGFIQSSSFQHEPYPMERVEIIGNERNIIVDNVKHLEYNRPSENKMQDNPLLLENQNTLSWNPNLGHSSLYGHYGFELELESYIKAIIQKKVPRSTYYDITGTMLLLEKMMEKFH